MTVDQYTVSASVQIYRADPKILKPEGFGSGCIVTYRGHTLLLTVSHVTNIDDGMANYLETNIPVKGIQMQLLPVGGFIRFEVFKVSEGMDAADFDALMNAPGETLDVTFAKVDDHIVLRQPAMDFALFKVDAGEKVILDLDQDAADPEENQTYGFYGTVRQQHLGRNLRLNAFYMHDLKFHRSSKYFHMFLAPTAIKDADDIRGCSGAPILDSEGRIVALACQVRVGTKVVYGFSIRECMKLIDKAIAVNEL